MNKRALFALAIAAVAVAAAVSRAQQSTAPQQARPTRAVAVIVPTVNNTASGTVVFTTIDGGLHVTGEITGLAPNSKHGFHIHEFGDMTVKDGTGMGGHFNPAGVDHGLMDQSVRHAGDMGNIEADANGVAKIDKTFTGAALGGRNNVLGRGIIVHEKPDDGGQPTGNAGGRIGYGVIAVAKSV